MAKVKTLNDLFIEQLKDAYSAEKQLLDVLPKMAKSASNPQLQQALQTHLDVSKQQKERLDSIFDKLGTNPGRTKCKGMEGVLAEGEEMMSAAGDPAVHDALLIAAAQKAEHYEMATYGTLRTYAQVLGDPEIANLLQRTLDEEGQADHTLTKIAESGVNQQAATQSGSSTSRMSS